MARPNCGGYSVLIRRLQFGVPLSQPSIHKDNEWPAINMVLIFAIFLSQFKHATANFLRKSSEDQKEIVGKAAGEMTSNTECVS